MSSEETADLMNQDEKGVYFEEVGKIVDAIVVDVADVTAKEPLLAASDVEVRLRADVAGAAHTNNDELCYRVLRWSNFPTAYFFEFSSLASVDWQHRDRIRNEPSYRGRPWDKGRRPFPWRQLARVAMEADVREELCRRPEMRALAPTNY
jgi:hypothetical protein